MKYLPITLSIIALLVALNSSFNQDIYSSLPTDSGLAPESSVAPGNNADDEIASLQRQIRGITQQLQALNTQLAEFAFVPHISADSSEIPGQYPADFQARQKKILNPKTTADIKFNAFLGSSEDTIRTMLLMNTLQNKMIEHGLSADLLGAVECREFGCRIDISERSGLDEQQITAIITSLEEPPMEFSIHPADASNLNPSTIVYLK